MLSFITKFRSRFLPIFDRQSFGATRSPQWPEVQKAHLQSEPLCAVCQTKGHLLNQLNVHHIRPFHIDPALELADTNLITLCRVHHFWFGHLGSWKSFNVFVRQDSATWKAKIINRPFNILYGKK